MAVDELPGLIETVYASLAKLGQETAAVEEKREPAVSVRASVKPDMLTCLECGAKMKMLKRHLGTDHGLTPAEYRIRWNLNSDYPMVAPDYAAKRAELAKKIGLGRKPRAAAPVAADATPEAPSEGPTAPKTRGRKKLGIAAAD